MIQREAEKKLIQLAKSFKVVAVIGGWCRFKDNKILDWHFRK